MHMSLMDARIVTFSPEGDAAEILDGCTDCDFQSRGRCGGDCFGQRSFIKEDGLDFLHSFD